MGEGRSEGSHELPYVLGRRREAEVAPVQRELMSVASEEEEEVREGRGERGRRRRRKGEGREDRKGGKKWM